MGRSSFVGGGAAATPLNTSLIAAYDFESGALEDDSFGTTDWTNRSAPNAVSIDAARYKVNLASALFESANKDAMKILDGALPAGFPFKSGGSNKWSVCSWFYIVSLDLSPDGQNIILAKQNATDTDGPMIGLYRSGYLRYYHSNYLGTDLLPVVTGRWYHFGLTYDGSTGGPNYPLYCKLWDDTALSAVEYDNPTFPSLIGNGGNAKPLSIGMRSYFDADWEEDYSFDGNIDAMRIYTDILTEAEIDADRLATGILGGGGTPRAILNNRLSS